MPSALPASAYGLLTIDLGAVVENYRRLLAALDGRPLAPVVKADAYGLGTAAVATALARAGAHRFFVAQVGEGIALRAVLDRVAPEREIFVLNGVLPGTQRDFLAHGLIPVLNSLGDIATWTALARAEGRPLPAALHVDSGMNRLGLAAAELDRLAADSGLLDGTALALVMSHLACAEQPDHPLNREQLARFAAARARLPAAAASFANSSGIFLGADFHFDEARPGAALYGVNPTPGKLNPMTQVIKLQGKILQVREIDAGQTVGYGATHKAKRPARIATIGAGYADGYLRALSGRTSAWIAGREVPVVGRISMDLITIDVTDLPLDGPSGGVQPGDLVELLDPVGGVDSLGADAGTIGYEILTALGRRYHRTYLGEAPHAC